LGVTDLATDRLPLEQAPDAYAAFQKKEGGTIKVVFQPS
jgi:threonine dehydrogenase-like Zn-dependent dehydrogenase